VDHACKRCCRVHLNATCHPIEPYEILPDGTPCIQGICNKVCNFLCFLPICVFLESKDVEFFALQNELCFISQGQCERTVHDVVERFWDIIEDININRLLKFLKDNIIFTVAMATTVIWIPGSVIVSYIDRRAYKLVQKLVFQKSFQFDFRPI